MSTYTPIASQTLSTSAPSVTFSSIPQGYTDLVLVINAAAVSGSSGYTLRFRVGNSSVDTNSNYSWTQLIGDGSSASSGRNAASSPQNTYMYGGRIDGTTNWGTTIANFMNYANTNIYKTAIIKGGVSTVRVGATVNLWRSTSAINVITITNEESVNFATNSTFSLYGIQVGQAAQKAQGGNIVTTDGTYVYHTFTSSGAFIPNEALTVDYLVVAGGGGGGGRGGGGGGAGGMRCTVTASGGSPGTVESALSLAANTSYTVAVGAGGAGGNNMTPEPTTQGKIGSNSVFGSVTSNGGGSGGGTNGENGGAGGSGGGGGAESGTGGAASPSGQGFAGGAGNSTPRGGGGGGASATGASGSSSGNGGAGRATSISGSSVTYAGGGGGGAWNAIAGGTGGSGGGGNGGAASTNGSNATANTGGGGGAGGHNGTGGASNFGGAGGSGIIIIRYAI